eukprot:gene7989-10832_t
MASHDDHYTPGEMDIAEQSAMYQSFLVATQWGCVLISAMVACMALIWGADVPWLQAVLGCGALSIVAGLGMKMGSAFTITSRTANRTANRKDRLGGDLKTPFQCRLNTGVLTRTGFKSDRTHGAVYWPKYRLK